ncbi:uncharacterized protein DUF3822 [Mucilaginibacter yixingensis]|uniref:Uncharacterized protein DUF3822 n=1 Tax=Mucilaginibacter yixingensis TaxID=1295612 RepID=A0A2T5JAN3_9SPHI|nr:DUF3822 family protein [Mucilaginibacter yixingensis]PTQ97927.1 uncharacterized protein DUF3822 [Mucilaginibacter yixingensis]
MSDYSFTYQQHNFSPEQAANATLYIRAGKSGISYLIAADNQVQAWKDYCSWADVASGNVRQLLSLPYQQVVAGLLPDALTLLPEALCSSEDVPVYARYLDVKGDDKVFITSFIEDNRLLYKVNAEVIKAIGDLFEVQTAVPADRGWVTAVANRYPSSDYLYINIAGSQLSVLSFKDQKLQLYNSFEVSNIDDILYYTLFVADQLQMRHADTSLVVAGDMVEGGGDYQKLSGFFKQVQMSDLRVLQLPYDLPGHLVLALTALS